MVFFPSNERETVELYKLVQDKLGWPIVHLQTAFPDAIIESTNGKQLVAEFEYLAKNFKAHKHDPNGCDLIICWRNDWEDAPLPVWALKLFFHPEINRYRRFANAKIKRYESDLAWAEKRIQELEKGNSNLIEQLYLERREIAKREFECFGGGKIKIAGIHSIRGIAQVYTDTTRDADQFSSFMWRIVTIPEVQTLITKWAK